jgi:hypothetical protein
VLLAITCACLGGCAHYEFDLVQPTDLARHIGDNRQERFARDPLEYRMQSAEGRLVIKVFNPTGDTILLLGRLSSAVDPGGESHPLADQTIAPSSFVKLILPPMRPQVTPSGPSIGIGVGAAAYDDSMGKLYPSYRDAWMYSPDVDFRDDHPRYYSIYDGNDPIFWDWQGETEVKLTLVFRRGNDQFQHEFVFHRKKM